MKASRDKLSRPLWTSTIVLLMISSVVVSYLEYDRFMLTNSKRFLKNGLTIQRMSFRPVILTGIFHACGLFKRLLAFVVREIDQPKRTIESTNPNPVSS